MLALYSDSAGAPGSVRTSCGSTAIGAIGWNTIAVTPVNISAGEYYWLAWIVSSGHKLSGNTFSGANKYKSASYSGFSFPNNPTGLSPGAWDISVAGWGAALVGGVGLVGEALIGDQIFFGPKKFFG